jgi:anti-sigma regulatory factor (Ser/Thr protein kinase)
MTRLRKNSELIRAFIIESVENNLKELISTTAKKFNISRQAVHKHFKRLVDQKILIHSKRSGQYELCPQQAWSKFINLIKDAKDRQEDVVWRTHIRPQLGVLPDNVIAIWQFGFTEMFNNVVDHSESSNVFINIKKTAHSTEMMIFDRGVGIFNKIKQAMNLLDERHAILELTKGKLTTEPTTHTGEGIFFTSRMFDMFSILSGGVFLSHTYSKDEDWILETQKNRNGTIIIMKLKNNTSRTLKGIFDKFASPEVFGFTKTVVPVMLAQYGDERLVSRSQAKRLLERVDRFKTVLLDFNEVDSIGQAFADEVFRVFANGHPNIEIVAIRANKNVEEMINRVKINTNADINLHQESLF